MNSALYYNNCAPPPAPPLPTIVQLARETQARVWQYLPAVVFWVAIPAAVYVIKERRGLSFAELFASLVKVPLA